MRNTRLRAVEKLSLALKQSENAKRNLQFVQVWARRNSQEYLEQGALDLVHRMAQLTNDLGTLILSVRVHAGEGRLITETKRTPT
jgi:hypothetical protein